MKVTKGANKALFMSTLAFTFCFAAWLLNGIPVLTGAIFRLPTGILTDKLGGKPVFSALLLICAIPMYLLSYANDFWSFALCSLGFGIPGASFAVVWFPKERQGIALGIFGAGNAGAAITTLIGPKLLDYLTDSKINLDRLRYMPKNYATSLVIMALLFFLTTKKLLLVLKV